MSAAVPTTSWPKTADELCKLLGLDINRKKCHGQTKQDIKCTIGIKTKVPHILSLLKEIITLRDVQTSKPCLERLSTLVMCSHHEWQASHRLLPWENVLGSTKTSIGKVQQTVRVSLSAAELVFSIQSSGAQPSTEAKIESTTVHPINNSSPLPTLASRSPNKKPIPKKSLPEKTKPVKDVETKHYFKCYGSSRSTKTINETIRDYILRELTVEERHSEGSVYVYTFPSEYRAATPYLKIGHSKNIERRMKEWRSKCGYTPKQLASLDASLYVKAEGLVHKHLHNKRKVELQCPKCGVNHKEWFDVTSSEACGIIGLWTAWTRQLPYDDAGKLKDTWRKKLGRVNLDDPKCWESFVHSSDEQVTEEEVVEVEDETELSEEDSFQWSDDDESDDYLGKEDEEEYECYDK